MIHKYKFNNSYINLKIYVLYNVEIFDFKAVVYCQLWYFCFTDVGQLEVVVLAFSLISRRFLTISGEPDFRVVSVKIYES